VTLLAPVLDPVAEGEPPGLLIREARRRQRHRWLAVLLATVVAATSYAVVQATTAGTRSVLSLPLLTRPMHLPSLGPNGSCPTSSGRFFNNPVTGNGPFLGGGPVRLEIGNEGDLARGQLILGRTSSSPHWYGIEVIWLSLPNYQGPFIVRGARIGGVGRIDVSGVPPAAGPLVEPAGRVDYGNSGNGYRALPNDVLVGAPGCYGLQVDGRGFSEVIVVDAIPQTAST
jgi:hypothetical protein